VSCHRSAIRRAAAALLLITALLPSTGCNIAAVSLLIPDFDSADVLGLQFWKLDPASGVYRTAQRVEFGSTLVRNGGETLFYSVWKGKQRVASVVPTVVERGSGEGVTLRVVVPSLDTGVYRVSSFNAAGRSPLSRGRFSY